MVLLLETTLDTTATLLLKGIDCGALDVPDNVGAPEEKGDAVVASDIAEEPEFGEGDGAEEETGPAGDEDIPKALELVLSNPLTAAEDDAGKPDKTEDVAMDNNGTIEETDPVEACVEDGLAGLLEVDDTMELLGKLRLNTAELSEATDIEGL